MLERAPGTAKGSTTVGSRKTLGFASPHLSKLSQSPSTLRRTSVKVRRRAGCRRYSCTTELRYAMYCCGVRDGSLRVAARGRGAGAAAVRKVIVARAAAHASSLSVGDAPYTWQDAGDALSGEEVGQRGLLNLVDVVPPASEKERRSKAARPVDPPHALCLLTSVPGCRVAHALARGDASSSPLLILGALPRRGAPATPTEQPWLNQPATVDGHHPKALLGGHPAESARQPHLNQPAKMGT